MPPLEPLRRKRLGSAIGWNIAHAGCEDNPDSFCPLESAAGALIGMAVGAPIGHVIGVGIVGGIQQKRRVPLAMIAAIAGDALITLGAVGMYNYTDNSLLSNEAVNGVLLGITGLGMVALPVVTQSWFDYHARFTVPHLGLSPGRGILLGLTVASVTF